MKGMIDDGTFPMLQNVQEGSIPHGDYYSFEEETIALFEMLPKMLDHQCECHNFNDEDS
jgi:hypothetical protein